MGSTSFDETRYSLREVIGLMRAHYFQHVPFEGLGSIQPWLDAAGYEVTCTRFFESARLPELDDVDFLIAMGGPMSVNDDEALPWLVPEKHFMRRAVKAGKPVLGVCLGAQLIASAMGARVHPQEVKEIGWFPVHGVDGVGSTGFRFPGTVEAFHWHGETFDLPPGAVRLAHSDGCENQAFQVGRSVIGVQCHLETTPETARHCPGAAGTPCTQPCRDVASQNNGGETDAVSGT